MQNPSFENRDPKRPVLIVLTFVRVQDKAELCVQRAVQRDGGRVLVT